LADGFPRNVAELSLVRVATDSLENGEEGPSVVVETLFVTAFSFVMSLLPFEKMLLEEDKNETTPIIAALATIAITIMLCLFLPLFMFVSFFLVNALVADYETTLKGIVYN
jgi:hypothetical protein